MKTITITLGGQEYTVQQLPIGQSKAWRGKFGAPVEKLVGALQFTGGMLSEKLDTATAGANLGKLIGALGQVLLGDVGQTLIGSMDLVLEMLFDYSPELKADRARIEATAFDDEAMAAFVEVLKLAYPFGGLLKIARPGPAETPIKRN
ncbi:MAG TPA: hypothetical protein VF498_05465 [Anaerolineales bacterium]